jgi:hypothetical protein
MMARSSIRWRPFTVQMALALLGCGSVCAADLRAACGDYVLIRNVGASASILTGEVGPLAPCNSPECSQPDAPYAPSPASVPTWTRSSLEAVLPLVFLNDPTWSTRIADDLAALPSAFTSDIFRPPRA